MRPAWVLLGLLALARPAPADEAWTDPLAACDRAALAAEAEWHLPSGLLSAIGIVESGRSGLGRLRPVAWPWSVTADGRDLYPPGRPAAVAAVRALQAAGARYIDVGCFQIDLLYHPEAFASLEAAFDPAANAQAAARLLSRARLASGSWEAAIALYHSATPMRGARYLQQVQAAWPWARARSASIAAGGPDGFVPLLSQEAGLVRVIAGGDPPAPDEEAAGLPRLLGPRDAGDAVQRLAPPPEELPEVIAPPPRSGRIRGRD